MHKGHKAVPYSIELSGVMSFASIDIQCVRPNAGRCANPLRRYAKTATFEAAADKDKGQPDIILVAMWSSDRIFVELKAGPTKMLRHTGRDQNVSCTSGVKLGATAGPLK